MAPIFAIEFRKHRGQEVHQSLADDGIRNGRSISHRMRPLLLRRLVRQEVRWMANRLRGFHINGQIPFNNVT